jgi:hypothetical protein
MRWSAPFIEGEEFDVIWYEAKRGAKRGKFIHRSPHGQLVCIDVANEYDALSLEQRTVIVKLHGAVNREDARLDSYVVTEDNYIDYLATTDIANEIPATLRERIADSHFLFLGYSMRDWNLRVVLNRIWGQSPLDVKSWAIQRAHESPRRNDIEKKLWANRGDIELVQVPLKSYVEQLEAQLRDLSGSADPQ